MTAIHSGGSLFEVTIVLVFDGVDDQLVDVRASVAAMACLPGKVVG
jgi:hypothetical protein